MGVSGKILLVAGVGPGLGTAVVNQLASDGATVVAVARSEKALGPIEAHARARKWKVTGRTVDVLDPAQVARVVADVVTEFGRIDGVSINAGHWLPGETLLHRLSEEEWSGAIQQNLYPIYRVGKAVIPHFLERHEGSIVAVSAAPAIRFVGSASYCAAKAGVAELVPKLARDYRSSGIRVNGVLPGSMANHLDHLDPPSDGSPVPLREETPTSPWEVARAIRYFLSDDSRWVTGALLTVDGGLSTGGEESPAAP
jgi:NAD(P)-dependent dehydrogenase (short-subunit alcohol dehydrogenase family)